MYSWVNILLEEAAFSRKKKQFNKSGLFYRWATLTNVIASEYPNFENLVD
jgi:hypothetical protein